jgi:serine phosphatase RsbU (regulator of sigma subunit)
MRQIGGDLLFVHPPAGEEDGPLSVVLLDVTGHGIAAALSVNRLIGELERLFGESPEATPDDVLNALNNYVHFTMARHDMYVTAVAMKIDPHSNTLVYASAGHPTAFLRRVDGTVIELESTTMLLGIADNAVFSPDALRMTLQNGDCIVAYTDGASEARSEQTHEMLGMTGVRQTMEAVAGSACPCEQWPTEIMRRVAAFRNAPPLDDTLLVALQRL